MDFYCDTGRKMDFSISPKHQHWLEEYLQNCQRLNKSAHTIKNYRADLSKFLQWFESQHKKMISKASGQIVGQYKDFLTHGGNITAPSNLPLWKKIFFFWQKVPLKIIIEQRPMAVASRRRHLSSLKNFFEFLKQQHEDQKKLFLINPVKPKLHGIKLKDIDVNHTKTLTMQDWNKLYDSVYRTQERLIIYLLFWGGLRLEELTKLRFSYFDERSKSIRFPRKGGKVHTLFPQRSDQIFTQLNYQKQFRRHQSDFLFINSRGEPLRSRSMYNIVMRMLKKAQCQEGLGPHSFRKGCATYLYKETKDLLAVRDYLNHRDAQVTQTYIDSKLLNSH